MFLRIKVVHYFTMICWITCVHIQPICRSGYFDAVSFLIEYINYKSKFRRKYEVQHSIFVKTVLLNTLSVINETYHLIRVSLKSKHQNESCLDTELGKFILNKHYSKKTSISSIKEEINLMKSQEVNFQKSQKLLASRAGSSKQTKAGAAFM